MGQPVSRFMDISIGICPHGTMPGFIIASGYTVLTNNLYTGLHLDFVFSFCLIHFGLMILVSDTTFALNLGKARRFDLFAGNYNGVMLMCSPDVFAGP